MEIKHSQSNNYTRGGAKNAIKAVSKLRIYAQSYWVRPLVHLTQHQRIVAVYVLSYQFGVSQQALSVLFKKSRTTIWKDLKSAELLERRPRFQSDARKLFQYLIE